MLKYKNWRKWAQCCGNSKFYKILVLLEVVHSPSYERCEKFGEFKKEKK